ncbi:MAG: hypothetical protein K8T90_13540 [Planctomycetes bacterium]|nr:hypothetical protein [Planctomycetota bacterium]
MTRPEPENDDSDGAGDASGASEPGKSAVTRGRRGPRPGADQGLERIAEVHYCRTDSEANEYLALGPEWDLQDIVPMRADSADGGERDEIHYVVARWETDRDRARLRQRDRRFSVRGKKPN